MSLTPRSGLPTRLNSRGKQPLHARIEIFSQFSPRIQDDLTEKTSRKKPNVLTRLVKPQSLTKDLDLVDSDLIRTYDAYIVSTSIVANLRLSFSIPRATSPHLRKPGHEGLGKYHPQFCAMECLELYVRSQVPSHHPSVHSNVAS